jgi:hypothetical protein
LDQATVDKKLQQLKDYGRDLVEKKAREKAGEVFIRSGKFSFLFFFLILIFSIFSGLFPCLTNFRFSTVFRKDNVATVKDALSAVISKELLLMEFKMN